MKKENQRIMLTKQLLRNGLLRLLENKSIEKVTVTELCKEAGINRATFYTHYQIPHDILLEMEHDIIDDIEALQKQLPIQNFQTYTETLCQYLYEHADLVRVLIHNFSGQDFAEMLNKTYKNILDSSIAKDVDKDNLKLITTYFAGGGYFLLTVWLQEDIKKTPKEIAQLISSLFSENAIIDIITCNKSDIVR